MPRRSTLFVKDGGAAELSPTNRPENAAKSFDTGSPLFRRVRLNVTHGQNQVSSRFFFMHTNGSEDVSQPVGVFVISTDCAGGSQYETFTLERYLMDVLTKENGGSGGEN
jgi:hypothetical protein